MPAHHSPTQNPEVRHFSVGERLQIWLISTAATLLIRLICPTLRYTMSYEEGAREPWETHESVWVFWHRCVLPAVWRFRDHGIAVMTSRSFDGEYIARIIEHFGFRAVRGSSSRGAVRALLGMHTALDQGRHVAFTIDGPRGPKYVAKPGPTLLSRNTQKPVAAFYVALARHWTLNSWDQMLIPKPFSRALVRVSRAIHVPEQTGLDDLKTYHDEMQAALDRVTAWAESHVAEPGAADRDAR
jgi:lysophospholipid acyltransferase (LPLAT)-like uncharacterized protein